MDDEGPAAGTDAESVDTESIDPDSADAQSTDEPEGSVAGSLAPDVPIEPEVVDPANAAFVVLGAYVGILAIAAFLAPQRGLSIWDLGWLTLGFLTLAGLAYAFFSRMPGRVPE